jgi:hypothetical protein
LIDLYQTGIIALEEIKPRLECLRERIKALQQEYALLEEEKHREQNSCN